MAPRLQLRTYNPVRDRSRLDALWQLALAPTWPILPTAIDRLRTGILAEAAGGAEVVGFVAIDYAGSIPLLVVSPGWQRQGVGGMLLEHGLARLQAAGISEVTAGSGGDHYIWPGVPLNLPAGVAFFTARGWLSDYDCLDLIRDLRDYRAPVGIGDRARAPGTVIAPATGDDRKAIAAFETAHFPQWARWFGGDHGKVLLARDGIGSLVGSLLYEFPDPGPYQPMLGPLAGNISCVGVRPDRQDQGIGTAMVAHASELLRDAGCQVCHIGWAVREAFYQRAGYRLWRRYRMFRAPQGSVALSDRT